ncbi:hypothetical protein K9M79_02800 [Candidatus Woesearchaeota archaeon]|nr:hypothetical protein [Candidatus Woesearchaeota archaeon]
MEKKGQGLSMTYIILAAIGLIVFVVILAIFSGGIFDMDTKMDKCPNNGGNCVAKGSCSTNGGAVLSNIECPNSDGSAADPNQECCVSGN